MIEWIGNHQPHTQKRTSKAVFLGEFSSVTLISYFFFFYIHLFEFHWLVLPICHKVTFLQISCFEKLLRRGERYPLLHLKKTPHCGVPIFVIVHLELSELICLHQFESGWTRELFLWQFSLLFLKTRG